MVFKNMHAILLIYFFILYAFLSSFMMNYLMNCYELIYYDLISILNLMCYRMSLFGFDDLLRYILLPRFQVIRCYRFFRASLTCIFVAFLTIFIGYYISMIFNDLFYRYYALLSCFSILSLSVVFFIYSILLYYLLNIY